VEREKVRQLFWGGIPTVIEQEDDSEGWERMPTKPRLEAYLYCARKTRKDPIPSGRFRALVKQSEGAASQLSSELDEQIEKDLDRTFSDAEHRDIKDYKSKLRRVLRAYALQDPAVGYCQGLNFIAGFLLFFFEEHYVFEMMVAISAHMFSGYFVQSMVGIRVDMMACIAMLQQLQPTLHDHLQGILPAELVVQGPLQTLFIEYLPAHTVLRHLKRPAT